MDETPLPKRSSKKFLTIFLCLVLLSTILLASLPSLVSTHWGKNKLTSWINKSIPGKMTIGDLSIGWFGPQKITDLKLTGPDGATVISLESFKIDTSVFSALVSPAKAAQLEFHGLDVHLSTDKDGTTNLMRALDKQCCETGKIAAGTPVDAKIKDGRGSVSLSSANGGISLDLSGKTLQGNSEGTFSILAELGGVSSHDLLSARGIDMASLLASSPDAELKVQADIVNFPVEVVDQIVTLRAPEYAGLAKELLGNSLNLSVRQKAAANGVALNLTGSSPTLNLTAEALLEKELTLTKPAVISLQITKEFFNKLAAIKGKSNEWKLLSPTSARLTFSKLTFPADVLSDTTLNDTDLIQLGLEASLEVDPASFSMDGGKTTLSLKKLHGDLKTTAGESTAALSVNGEADHQGKPVRINFNLTVPKTASFDQFEPLLSKGLTIDGSLTGAAPLLVESLSGSQTRLTDIFGAEADLTFSLSHIKDKVQAKFSVDSEHIEIPSTSFTIDDKIKLMQPTRITFKGVESLLIGLVGSEGPHFQGPLNAQLSVKDMSVPLSALSYLDTTPMVMAYKMLLDAQLTIPSLQVSGIPSIGGAAVNNLVFRIDAEPKKRPEISLSFGLDPSLESNLTQLLGDHATIQTFASLGIGLGGQPTVNVFNIQISSDIARLDASGEMREGNQLVLNTPSMINYTITTAGLQAMGLPVESYLFSHETPLQLTIDSSHIPLAWNDLSKLRLHGKINIDDLQLMKQGDRQMTIAALDNLKADWSVDAAAKRIGIDFNGMTRLGEKQAAGKLDGTIAIDRWITDGAIDLSNATVRVDTMATNLPTELVGVFTGNTDLVPILGSAIDIDLKGNASMASNFPGTLSLSIESEHLKGGLALTLGEVISLSNLRPAEFALNLTPQGYAALRKRFNPGYAGDFVIVDGTTANLKLRSLSIPRDRSLMEGGLNGIFTVGAVTGLDRRSKEKIHFESIKGSINSDHLADRIEFALNANGQSTNGVPSNWVVNGTLDKGFSADGSVNRQDLSLSLDATVESLPVPLLCQFACVDPSIRRKFEAVIGTTLDAKVKANLRRMNGPVFVDVKGNNGHLSVDATLKDGIVFLNRDLTAELKVTPELGEYVLKDVIPVISGMLSATHPIKLTIAQQGFSLPLRSPSIENITIGQAVLDMGKVTFSNDSQIARVLSLLVSSSSDNVLVWLTPAYFSLNQGYVKLERVDMLISDRYPIAAWGDADIGRDRVNMVIGLSGAAIRKAFNISGISNTDFLQLPLKGRLHNPSIDKAKAAGRISALVAQSQGGPQGLVLGTVLDIATGGLSESAPPAPTTNPLPWSNMMQEDGPSSEAKGNSDSKKGNPIEEVGKGAKKILKNIFK